MPYPLFLGYSRALSKLDNEADLRALSVAGAVQAGGEPLSQLIAALQR